MLEQDKLLEETLQAIQNADPRGGGLVTAFVGIAEVAHSSDPNATGYMIFCRGTPAMRRGLLEELKDAIQKEIAAKREDG